MGSLKTPRQKEGPAAWIAAGAAVVAIPVAILIGFSAGPENGGGPPATTPMVAAGPAQTTVVAAAGDCVRGDGTRIECGNADAWLPVPTSSCDPASASQALGADPDKVELQVEARNIDGACAVAPTAAAKSAGATISDLQAIGKNTFEAAVLTCWTAPDPRTSVPCNQLHRFEPVAAWRPLQDPGQLQSVCQEAARSYVAETVDSMNGALSTSWVTTQEEQPRFRCLVQSRSPLTGTVYRLSGRPLPTATAS